MTYPVRITENEARAIVRYHCEVAIAATHQIDYLERACSTADASLRRAREILAALTADFPQCPDCGPDSGRQLDSNGHCEHCGFQELPF